MRPAQVYGGLGPAVCSVLCGFGLLVAALLLALLPVLVPDMAGAAPAQDQPVQSAQSGQSAGRDALPPLSDGDWRLRIREAAAVEGDTVTLGDIADPYGPLPPVEWQALARRSLWPAPPEPGRPLQISKARLTQVLRERLGALADRCLLPQGLAIQRGGVVWTDDDLRQMIVKDLTPSLHTLGGQIDLTDYRLPSYMFLTHAGQQVEVEPVRPVAGRLNLRFVVKEVDGAIIRRFTGSVFVNVWADVPCALTAYNRGDVLRPEGLTTMRKNLAHIRGDIWDGRGGPWQATRALTAGQPILASDITQQVAVRRGDMLTLLFERGSVRVSAKAEALADGSLGETIPVRNLQSRKQIYATVQDSNTVVVK